MDLIKIKETDDHREYGDASIRLDADEMRAFFGTFARVDEEFRQLIANLKPRVVVGPAFGHPSPAATATSLKRKASSLPAATASTFQKRIATLQAEEKVPKLKIDLTKTNNM